MQSRFDERQLVVRGRVAMTTLFLLVVAVVLNGMAVDTWGQWGTGLQQAFTIIWPALGIMCALLVWRHAYIRPGEIGRRAKWLVFAMGVWLVIAAGFLVAKPGDIWSGGRPGDAWPMLMLAIFQALVVVTFVLRWWLDRRHLAEPEDD